MIMVLKFPSGGVRKAVVLGRDQKKLIAQNSYRPKILRQKLSSLTTLRAHESGPVPTNADQPFDSSVCITAAELQTGCLFPLNHHSHRS
jgi:hypothetical protein